jgi:prevent-host-death family protein
MERAAAGEEILVTRRGKPSVRLASAEDHLPLAQEPPLVPADRAASPG